MASINVNQYRNIWFCSDLHLGHDKQFLWGPRGRIGRDDHVAWLLGKFRKYVGPHDLVISCGDLALTCTYEELQGWLGQINCKEFIHIRGNHDNRADRLARDQIFDWFSVHGVTEQTFAEHSKVRGEKAKKYHITFSHFPYEIWNHCGKGSWHLCGHSHGNFVKTTPSYLQGKRLDCGVENAIKWNNNDRPFFSWEEIKTIMNRKEIYAPDHH